MRENVGEKEGLGCVGGKEGKVRGEDNDGGSGEG